MNFKEVVENDINNVFMDLEVFSEKHNIDGNMLDIIVDENELIKRELKTDNNDREHKHRKLIYVKATDLDSEPRIDMPLRLDKKIYLIKDITEEAGIYSLVLEVNRNWWF